MNVIERLFAGVRERMAPDAYAPYAPPPPIDYIGAPGMAYTFDDGQRFARPYPLFRTLPSPLDGWQTMVAGARTFALLGTVDIYSMLHNAQAKIPSGPFIGDPRGVTVLGGMSFGYPDINGLQKQTG